MLIMEVSSSSFFRVGIIFILLLTPSTGFFFFLCYWPVIPHFSPQIFILLVPKVHL